MRELDYDEDNEGRRKARSSGGSGKKKAGKRRTPRLATA